MSRAMPEQDLRLKEFVMKAMKLLARFTRDERGMETVEWAVLAALIVAGLVSMISLLGGNVLAKFTTLKNATDTVPTP